MISNLINDKGNKVKNQFVIKATNATFFQSYDTMCAKFQNGVVYLNKDYFGEEYTSGSTTTRTHLHNFLYNHAYFARYECSAKEIKKLIKCGDIVMVGEEELKITIS